MFNLMYRSVVYSRDAAVILIFIAMNIDIKKILTHVHGGFDMDE